MDEQQEISAKKPNKRMLIVGINLIVLLIYTVICKMAGAMGGMISDAYFIVLQVVTCLITAIAVRKWVWVLSAVLVLLIGFSTCVEFLTLSEH